jgi:CRISPR-associated protein Csx16
MTVYFVSRHVGAKDWAIEQGIACDVCIPHLDPALVQPGDVVIGTLPVNMAAIVCEQGGRYLNLSLNLPLEARGRELSAGELKKYGARVEEFVVSKRSCVG